MPYIDRSFIHAPDAGIPHDKAQQWYRQSLCGASPSMQPAAPADKA
jgi:hypothetical protein